MHRHVVPEMQTCGRDVERSPTLTFRHAGSEHKDRRRRCKSCTVEVQRWCVTLIGQSSCMTWTWKKKHTRKRRLHPSVCFYRGRLNEWRAVRTRVSSSKHVDPSIRGGLCSLPNGSLSNSGTTKQESSASSSATLEWRLPLTVLLHVCLVAVRSRAMMMIKMSQKKFFCTGASECFCIGADPEYLQPYLPSLKSLEYFACV